MAARDFLGDLEQMVLLAILRCGDRAYAIEVRKRLAEDAGRAVSRGALYRTLDRLADKGCLSWRLESGGRERGGHPKRRLQVTAKGLRMLRQSRAALFKLWLGLDERLGKP